MKKAIAVFDVDGTIVKNASCEVLFVRYLLARGVLGIGPVLSYLAKFLTLAPRRWTLAARSDKSYLKGLSRDRLESLAGDCFRAEIAPRISDRARERIETHRAAGLEIVLLSGTLDFLLRRFREGVAADRVHGTELAVVDGRFTGEIVGTHPYGSGKAKIVREHYAPDAFDLDASFAYADQASDLEFLGLFGHPSVVNPSRRLARLAGERNIPVVHF